MAEEKPSVDSRPNETQPGQPSGAEQEASTGAVDVDLATAESAGDNEASDNAEDSNHTDAGADVAALQTQLEEANSIADKSRDDVLRIRAEMENLRKRQSRELENAHKYALDKIAMELLPVRDTLEMGVAAAETEGDLSKIAEGTGLTLKMLTQALEKFNIVEVDPQGDKFDPDLHQAISVQEGTDKPANTVLTVMQKGYTLNDRLLRPAMVVIAK